MYPRVAGKITNVIYPPGQNYKLWTKITRVLPGARGTQCVAGGQVFRRFDAPERWEPPSYFKYRTKNNKGEGIKFENKCTVEGYVTSLDENGNVTGLFENVVAASHLSDTDRTSLHNLTETPRVVKGVWWRKAIPGDYMTFVECRPPAIEE